jgi:hypothetical protein
MSWLVPLRPAIIFMVPVKLIRVISGQKSDEIGCAHRVIIHDPEVSDTYYLTEDSINFVWLCMYESLRTCMVHLDLVRDPT